MLVKICGLTTPDAVRAAVDAGADAVGLVFAPGSPRDVSPDQAEALLAQVPDGVIRVAVFRTPAPDVLDRVLALPFDVVQADAGWAGALPDRVSRLPAFSDGPDLLSRLAAHGVLGRPHDGLRGAFLVDGPRGGGMGVRGEVSRAAAAARRGPLVLAGGLDPDNVADAVRAVRPVGVDVSSGVERAPGDKDPRRIAQFVAAARAAGER